MDTNDHVRTPKKDVIPRTSVSEFSLAQEFAEELNQLIEEFDLDKRSFYVKLAIGKKSVIRWRASDVWPSRDNWDNFKLKAHEFVTQAQRPRLMQKFSQLDLLIRKSRATKTSKRSSSAFRHQFPRADWDIVFWHKFRDRDDDGKSIGNLIGRSEERVIISGATLHQLVRRFEEDILAALDRGVLVGIVRARLTPDMLKLYEPYGQFDAASLSSTDELYRKLCDKLSSSQKRRFGLFETGILFTHSIGLYDEQLFVAEFVMHQHSERSPTYMLPPGSDTHNVLLFELATLLKGSSIICGEAQTDLLTYLNSSREQPE
jgi:hypothetical protein